MDGRWLRDRFLTVGEVTDEEARMIRVVLDLNWKHDYKLIFSFI